MEENLTESFPHNESESDVSRTLELQSKWMQEAAQHNETEHENDHEEHENIHEEYEEHEQDHQEDHEEPENAQEDDNTGSIDNKPSAQDYSYQDQKIIINEAEEEEISPTYKEFFEKDQKITQKSQQQVENDQEEALGKQIRKGPKRWEILYAKAIQSRAAKEELRKESEAQKDDPECTFRPQIATNAYNNRQSSPSGNNDILSVHERNRLWQNKKLNKMSEARDRNKDRDLVACTFQPDLGKSLGKDYAVKSLTAYGSKGVDQYLRRQIIAKQAKDEKDLISANPLAKLPPHVYKKEGNITIPKGPDFNRERHYEIHSIKRPFEFPTPRSTYRSTDPDSPSRDKPLNSQREVRNLVDPIHVNNVKFGQAVQMLHRELHRININ